MASSTLILQVRFQNSWPKDFDTNNFAETFPAPNRGTGTGVASFFNRVAGLCAPIVAIKGTGANPKVPIYVSGALMLSAFMAMVGLPIETRGKQFL